MSMIITRQGLVQSLNDIQISLSTDYNLRMYGIDSFVDGDAIRIMLQSQIHDDHVYKYTEFILICLFFFHSVMFTI